VTGGMAAAGGGGRAGGIIRDSRSGAIFFTERTLTVAGRAESRF